MTMVVKPPRTPWHALPSVVLHASETSVKRHVDYAAAKSGDARAAVRLVQQLVSFSATNQLLAVVGERSPSIVSAHAQEAQGINAIPEALANLLAQLMGHDVISGVFQSNIVKHTGAGGFQRLARQASFEGTIVAGRDYVLVDDFVGQGGTLANLKGHVETNGGRVIVATSLTGKDYSAILTPTTAQLAALRAKHGRELEDWWREWFGHGFGELTQSEARYLERSADADTIRTRIVAAQTI
jgi:hypothetical protein